MTDTIVGGSHTEKMAEIWRLRSVNAVLLTSLKAIVDQAVYPAGRSPDLCLKEIYEIARDAIEAAAP